MEKQCSLLQELRLSECVLQNCIKVEGQIAVQLPTPSPRKEFTPLSALGDWYDYFKYLNGFEAMGCINPDFTPAEMQLPTSASICQLVKLATDSSSMVLTALAALELADPDLSSRTRLTIHVVGATAHELMILRLNEEFLHLIPKLQTLTVGYIGPDVPVTADSSNQLQSSQCCPECTLAGRKRQVFLRKQLYHQCDRTSLFPELPPDLIMACHSGHSEEETNSWGPTLSRILDMDTPAVFTTYNKREAIDEQAVFSDMDARFLQEIVENRWRGMVPKLECFGARYEVYCFNHFKYVVRGRIS